MTKGKNTHEKSDNKAQLSRLKKKEQIRWRSGIKNIEKTMMKEMIFYSPGLFTRKDRKINPSAFF